MEHPPAEGERIMVFKEEWLKRIMRLEKKLEIRGVRYTRKTYLLGSKGKILGRCEFGEPIHIGDVAQWKQLRPLHCVACDKLPYQKTWGLPIEGLTAFRQPYAYTARKGAVGIAIYRGG